MFHPYSGLPSRHLWHWLAATVRGWPSREVVAGPPPATRLPYYLEPFCGGQVETFVTLLGEEPVIQWIPFSEGTRAGVVAALLGIVAQSQVGMEGVSLNEAGIMALPTGLHRGDRVAGFKTFLPSLSSRAKVGCRGEVCSAGAASGLARADRIPRKDVTARSSPRVRRSVRFVMSIGPFRPIPWDHRGSPGPASPGVHSRRDSHHIEAPCLKTAPCGLSANTYRFGKVILAAVFQPGDWRGYL